MATSKYNKAPKFARQFREKLAIKGITQKKLHDLTGISLSTINRIVKDGYGNINEIGMLTDAAGLPHNEKFNLLIARMAEVSEGPAKKILQHGLRLYRTTDEYLTDACPVPLNRAYAAAYFGISYQDIKGIADKFGIKDINKPNLANAWDIFDFLNEFTEKHGEEAAKAILKGDSSTEYPSVLQMNYDKVPASKYVKIINGKGFVIFDVPHVVLTFYDLGKGGKISKHKHKGGIEFAYCLEGKFKLIYEKTEYPTLMTKDGPIYIYDGSKEHSIELINCTKGKIAITRFYPDKRKLKGKTVNGEVSL